MWWVMMTDNKEGDSENFMLLSTHVRADWHYDKRHLSNPCDRRDASFWRQIWLSVYRFWLGRACPGDWAKVCLEESASRNCQSKAKEGGTSERKSRFSTLRILSRRSKLYTTTTSRYRTCRIGRRMIFDIAVIRLPKVFDARKKCTEYKRRISCGTCP